MKASKHSARFKIAFGLGLLLLIGLAVLLASIRAPKPTPTIDTTNWKSFNSQAGIQFKYPIEFGAYDVLNANYNGHPSPYISVGRPDSHKTIGYTGPKQYLTLIISIFTDDDFTSQPPIGVAQFHREYSALKSDERIIETIQIEGNRYQLIRKGGTAILATCDQHKNCRTAFKRPDNTYFTFRLSINGDTGSPEPKMDSTNPEYVDFINLLRSLEF